LLHIKEATVGRGLNKLYWKRICITVMTVSVESYL